MESIGYFFVTVLNCANKNTAAQFFIPQQKKKEGKAVPLPHLPLHQSLFSTLRGVSSLSWSCHLIYIKKIMMMVGGTIFGVVLSPDRYIFQRLRIISGVYEPTDAEAHFSEEEAEDEESDEEEKPKDAKKDATPGETAIISSISPMILTNENFRC